MSTAPEIPSSGMLPSKSDTTSDERTWAMLAHFSPLLGLVVSAGILTFLVPLVIWLIKKDSSPFVADQAKEALNFQLAVLIVNVILGITCIGIVLLPVTIIGSFIYAIIGGIEANKGVYYRYPYTIRMIS